MSVVLMHLFITEGELEDTDCLIIGFLTLEAEEYGPQIK